MFCRQDLPGQPCIAGTAASVASTAFSTCLKNEKGDTVETVEHLLSALFALRIRNARISLTGSECPILDGSAATWLSLLQTAGTVTQRATWPVLKITKKQRVASNRGWLEVEPSSHFSVEMTVPLSDGTQQSARFCEDDSFETDIATARTFTFKEHLQPMREKGLIQGGSLDNALVIDNGQPVNKDGWRIQNECARHKILDLLGDWALGGYLLQGRVRGYASGHTLNHQLLEKILPQTQERLFARPTLSQGADITREEQPMSA